MTAIDCNGGYGGTVAACGERGPHLPHGPRVDAALAAERDKCRYAELNRLLARFGDHQVIRYLPICPRAAEYTTTVVAVHDGIGIETYTPTCAVHDAEFQNLVGYLRSIKLRPPS